MDPFNVVVVMCFLFCFFGAVPTLFFDSAAEDRQEVRREKEVDMQQKHHRLELSPSRCSKESGLVHEVHTLLDELPH